MYGDANMKSKIPVALLVVTGLLFTIQPAFPQTTATANRGNAAPREALPEELRDLEVKDVYIGSDTQPAGFIRTVIGHVVVLHKGSGQAFLQRQVMRSSDMISFLHWPTPAAGSSLPPPMWSPWAIMPAWALRNTSTTAS